MADDVLSQSEIDKLLAAFLAVMALAAGCGQREDRENPEEKSSEQVEEEATASSIVEMIKRAGAGNLYFVDSKLGERQ